MFQTFPSLVAQRVSTNRFDPGFALSDADIHDLLAIAIRAPSAYNLQNWRFIAVRSGAGKRRLRASAFGQKKVEEASVTIIVCGQTPEAAILPERLVPCAAAGFMDANLIAAWQSAAASQYADPRAARDEAVRSGSLAAAFLILAAEAKGLASCPMVGFDPAALAEGFGLTTGDVPVMLVALGKAAPGNWPQKPRRAVEEVLSFQ